MISEYVFAPLFITTVLLPLTVWSIIWKGLALWRAAKNRQAKWFAALLIINTAGILEIIYLLAFADKYSPRASSPYKSSDTAIAKTAATMDKIEPRKQAIVSILMNLLDTEHQNSISHTSLEHIIQAIEQRLDGTITQSELLKTLDADASHGGAGLYTQTAQKIASHIDAIIKASKK